MENSSAEDAKDLFTNENNDAKDASKEGEQKPAPAKRQENVLKLKLQFKKTRMRKQQ